MSKKENKTISERVKLWIANKALRVAESMLAKERPAHIDPDKPNTPKEIKTPKEELPGAEEETGILSPHKSRFQGGGRHL